MKTSLGILALAGLLAATGLSHAAEAPKTPPKPKVVIKVFSFTDDIKKLDALLTLIDEQKAGFQAAREERDKELAAWDERSEKQIATLRDRVNKAAGKGAGAQKRAQGELDALLAGRDRIVAATEKKMFELLTAEQRTKYNTPILAGEVQVEFKDLQLTADQVDQITVMCVEPAGKSPEPLVPKKPPAIVKVLIGQTITTILTPEQRKKYSDAKNPAKVKPKSK